eukprot:3269091-Prorocentrum_lima.AAC.1
MMNREGEAHPQPQQRIEAVAAELIRVAHVTTTSLQRLAQYGENHKKCVGSALTTWTTSV